MKRQEMVPVRVQNEVITPALQNMPYQPWQGQMGRGQMMRILCSQIFRWGFKHLLLFTVIFGTIYGSWQVCFRNTQISQEFQIQSTKLENFQREMSENTGKILTQMEEINVLQEEMDGTQKNISEIQNQIQILQTEIEKINHEIS